MKSKPFSLSINQPCSEDWNKMSPSEKGKFCQKCQKSVIDFTTMRDHEIVSTIENSTGPICGKLLPHQMEHTYNLQYKKSHLLYPSILMSLLALQSAQDAQAGNSVEPSPTKQALSIVNNKSQSHTDTLTISGHIEDTAGQALPYVNVYLEDIKIGCVSDIDGNFSLSIPDSLYQKKYSLKVSSIGFEIIKYDLLHSDLPLEKNIVLKQDTLPIIGEIIILDKKKQRKMKRKHRKVRHKEKKEN